LSTEHKLHIAEASLRAHADGSVAQKISQALKGRPKSPEHIEKVRQALIGGKRTAEQRFNISEAHKGKKLSEVTCARLSEARKREYAEGRRVCQFNAETQRKTAQKAKLRIGPLHPNWIADRTGLTPRARRSDWVMAIYQRDKQCAFAFKGGCDRRLEAHHIKTFKDHPELRYDVDNGILLCKAHHPRKCAEVIKLAAVFEAIVADKKAGNWKG
jgi:hypothetical protein